MQSIITRLTLTLALSLSLHTFLAAQGTIAKLDEKNGFKDAKLDSDITAFQHLVNESCEPGNGPDVSCYTRTTDVLMVGTASLDKIQYTFYKGSLAAIMVTARGLSNVNTFCYAIGSAYGEGKHPYEGVNSVEWNGERVYMTLDVVKGDAKHEPVLTLVLRSTAQMARSKADRKESSKAAMQKAIDDL
ncbi:hypothetical protein [Hymenobacter sp. GOD-10R]|uniref:hypothetical protein n=1 Tax=Hymenobacter sp. GOD-10R TaxID=3093922 RepID=UPI002D773F4E|nr:hypothetical protein [Hymenobacter sp. GOD-10R]WRQ28126.1 hypothetical protein SD425_23970 [Hymenobacter sp. GOD-10R]